MKTAAICIIGDEVLCGRTQDTNSSYLARELDALGIRLRHIGVVPDEEDAIVSFIKEHAPEVDYLFTCGGIGPTPDDITRESVAKAFGLPAVLHPEAEKILRDGYGGQLTEARLSMGILPEGCRLIYNPVSFAPGFVVENVYVMAGIPKVMEVMFESLKPELAGGVPLFSVEIETTAREGDFTPFMREMIDRYPSVSIGSYPRFDGKQIKARLLLRSLDAGILQQAASAMRQGLKGYERK
jgi:molybdenum cofactor synthesis domain-containing protein